MKKLFSITLLSFLALSLLSFSLPVRAVECDVPHVFPPPPDPTGINYVHPDTAGSLVPCGQYPDCRCEMADIFVMALRIYNFIVWTISVPLAGLLIVTGGILIMVSGAAPKYYDMGKTMLWGSVIALMFIFGSWLFISIVLMLIGYTGAWSSF